jgi:hypothetical protein
VETGRGLDLSLRMPGLHSLPDDVLTLIFNYVLTALADAVALRQVTRAWNDSFKRSNIREAQSLRCLPVHRLHECSEIDVDRLVLTFPTLPRLIVQGVVEDGVLAALSGLTQLTMLCVSHAGIRDLDPLARLKGLRTLRLHNWGHVATHAVASTIDLAPLANLRNLHELYLTQLERGCGGTRSSSTVCLKALKGLTQLRELRIQSARVVDLLPLQGLNRLRNLSVSIDNSSSGIIELTPLARLTRLRSLRVKCVRVSGVASVKRLPQLCTFRLNGEQLINRGQGLNPVFTPILLEPVELVLEVKHLRTP